MLKSAKGLPANRESELRDALAVANAGFTALAMAEGVTGAQVECYRRQRDFLIDAAHTRYRNPAALNAALTFRT